ncbi:MAG: ChaN family lipoprotein [Planctomycetota bacterium]
MKRLTCILVCLLGTLTGCSNAVKPGSADGLIEQHAFDGATGERLSYDDVVARLRARDIIILGETHDDADGHAVQAKLTHLILDGTSNGALALEMLERDEQPMVDAWFDGAMSARSMAEETGSAAWAGTGSWKAWYQPALDAARAHDARIIAANAPRRYVRIANREGFASLEALPADERAYFVIPETIIDGPYADNFREIMTGFADDGLHDGMSEEDLNALFRSQLVWDATMSDSVAAARREGGGPVILLIGQFHSDFEGGTVHYLREKRPNDSMATVSLQPVVSEALREEDVDRADIVIYTGR